MTTIACAGCGADLSRAQFHTALVSVTPDKIDADFHFCRLGCLDLWRTRQHSVDAMWSAFLDARAVHHTEYGVAEGHIAAICPGLSFADHAARNAEFHQAALKLFPMHNGASHG